MGTKLCMRIFRIQRSLQIQQALFCVKPAKIQKQIFRINRASLLPPEGNAAHKAANKAETRRRFLTGKESEDFFARA
jgi:hypothetical protein